METRQTYVPGVAKFCKCGYSTQSVFCMVFPNSTLLFHYYSINCLWRFWFCFADAIRHLRIILLLQLRRDFSKACFPSMRFPKRMIRFCSRCTMTSERFFVHQSISLAKLSGFLKFMKKFGIGWCRRALKFLETRARLNCKYTSGMGICGCVWFCC